MREHPVCTIAVVQAPTESPTDAVLQAEPRPRRNSSLSNVLFARRKPDRHQERSKRLNRDSDLGYEGEIL
jgi:hypothetical protein